MRFTATGRYGPLPALVVWEDGAIVVAEPEELLLEVETLIRLGIVVSLPTFAPGEATLGDPVLAEATLAEVIDDFRVVEGDELPARYQLPPGAIGGGAEHYEPPERP